MATGGPGARIEDLLDELRRPGCYPGSPPDVEIVQTHISVVCLAGDRVYKLKKAVRLPFLDFTHLAARRHYCEEEVRLNRRLCPGIYLGVSPLRWTPRGLRFGDGNSDGAGDGNGDGDGDGDGHDAGETAEIVDYAVRMVRLPKERMLDRMLALDKATPEQMDELAGVVAAFHESARRDDEVRAAGAPRRLVQLMRDNFAESLPKAGACFDPELHRRLADRTEAEITRLLPELDRRAAADSIVEGHGDLHARNICMTEPPAIYDCIEFDLGFRCGDVATENAFLAMDLHYRGHRELAERYVSSYVERSGDRGMLDVLPALVAYRAMVRAKVAAIAAAEQSIPRDDRTGARESARRHMRLGATTLVEAAGPRLLLACGLPASGKSFLLERLAREAGWPRLATDLVRKELAGLAPSEHATAEHYGAAFSDLTYREVYRRAEQLLCGGGARVVMLDGNFPSRDRRAAAAAAARAAGAAITLLWFRIDEATARSRLARRAADETAVSDADQRVFEKLRSRFAEPVDEEGIGIVRIDGTAPASDTLDEVCAGLLAALDPGPDFGRGP